MLSEIVLYAELNGIDDLSEFVWFITELDEVFVEHFRPKDD